MDDESAVCAINRPLRRAGFIIKKTIVAYLESSVLGWKLKETELMQ